MNRGNSGDRRRQKAGSKAIREAHQEKQTSTSGWTNYGKSLIASVTGFGVLIYGIGYLCQLGHHKMLGVSRVEYPNDQVIFDGVCFFILTPMCVLISFCVSWLPWVILLLLVALFLLPRLSNRSFREESHRGNERVCVSKIVEIAVVILFHVIFFFLASMVLSQTDLLLSAQNQASPPGGLKALFTAITSHCPQLRRLLENGRSRSLYGSLFVLATVCSLCWTRYIVKSVGHRRSSRETSQLKDAVRRGFLALGFYFVLLLIVLVFCLYGFLVKSNKYPVIELEGTEARPFPAENLFVLGDSGSRTLLYSRQGEKMKIWWVEGAAYLPASRSKPPKSLFESKEQEGIKKNRKDRTPGKHGI